MKDARRLGQLEVADRREGVETQPGEVGADFRELVHEESLKINIQENKLEPSRLKNNQDYNQYTPSCAGRAEGSPLQRDQGASP